MRNKAREIGAIDACRLSFQPWMRRALCRISNISCIRGNSWSRGLLWT